MPEQSFDKFRKAIMKLSGRKVTRVICEKDEKNKCFAFTIKFNGTSDSKDEVYIRTNEDLDTMWAQYVTDKESS